MPSTRRCTQTGAMHTSHRIHPLQWVMAALALAAMLSAHFGWFSGYTWLKPLPMVTAMVYVAWQVRPNRRPIAWALLLLGLLLSMVGDICLLFPGGFTAGLGAFLCAHLAYIWMLRRDSGRWLPHPAALAVTVLIGLGLYAYLWTHGLPPALRLPVLAYVWVIAIMAAQAIGRATVLRTPAAWCVAAGAISFMASDSILAIDKFVQPVPASYLWVLGTYYLAQWLIVHGMLPARKDRPHQKES